MGFNRHRSSSRLDKPKTVYVPQYISQDNSSIAAQNLFLERLEKRIELVEKTVFKTEKSANPDPSNYRIVRSEQIGEFLLLKIVYPDCTNFEGSKILVFQNVNLEELKKQKLVDPHFFRNCKYKSPIARFIPTDDGWKMAQIFVKGMKSV